MFQTKPSQYAVIMSYLLLLVSNLYGQETPIDTLFLKTSQLEYDLAEYTHYFPTTTAKSITDWSSEKQVVNGWSLAQFREHITANEESYWGKIVVKNTNTVAQDYTTWLIRFSTYTTHLNFYLLDKGQVLYHQQTGGWLPLKQHTWQAYSYFYDLPLTIPPGATRTILYHLTDKRKFCQPTTYAQLYEKNYIAYHDAQAIFHNGIFLGLVAFFFMYSLLMYFFIREKTYLFYALYLIGVGLYYGYLTCSFTEFWYNYVFVDRPTNFHYLKHTFYLIPVGYLLFTNVFMDTKIQYPKWHRLFLLLLYLAIPVFILDCVVLWKSNLYFYYSDIIVISYSSLAILLVTCLLTYSFFLGDKNSYFLLGGFSCLAIGGLLYGVGLFGWLEDGLWVFKMGLIFEISIFTAGLVYQRKQNKEKQHQVFLQLQEQKWEQQQQAIETKRLKELDTLKSRLYTNITHDFRTPLTIIQGISSQITDSKYAKESALINRNSKDLLQLVNRLLDLSKLESGTLAVNMQEGNILPYLRYISESLQSLADNKQINLSFTTPLPALIMDYDAEKVLQILSNLLSNAIKFTPAKGHIKLSINQTEQNQKEYLQLTVADTGIGIAEEQLPYIFDRFYQTETATTRKTVGTGIGLSITQGLVHLLKGTITVKSQLKKGTTFEVLLPITNQATCQTTSLPEVAATYTQDIDVAARVATTNLLADKTAPLILLVEDNEDVLYYLITCLQSSYRILTALNGEQGIITAEEHIPDLIISDVMMPEMDGYALCTHLKNTTATSHIPIILLTAKTDQTSKLVGLQQGADAYLAKPFDQEELAIRITQLLKQRKQLQAYYTHNMHTHNMLAATPVPSIQDVFIQKVIEVVEQDLSADLPIAKLCQVLQLSQSQVYRKIKGVTGMSTTIFIRHIRLKNAHRLLTTTNLSISEIAYATGFKDPSFFSRSFSEIIGRSPSEVRDRG